MARTPRDTSCLLPPDGSHKSYRVRKYCLDPATRARLPAPYTGKTALIENLKTTDKREAERLAPRWRVYFDDLIAAARPRALDEVPNVRILPINEEIGPVSDAEAEATLRALNDAWAKVEPDVKWVLLRGNKMMVPRAPGKARPSMPPIKPAEHPYDITSRFAEPRHDMTASPNGVVDFEEVMALWHAERLQASDPPESKAITNKRNRMEELFEFVGHRDMGRVTEPQARAYRNKVLKEGTAYHKIHDIKSMYKVAKRGGLITTINVFADIEAGERAENKTPPLSDDEARRVLTEARRSPKPAVRWCHELAAFTTGMNSELLLAEASELYQIESGKWAGQWVWDMRFRENLKTKDRRRIVALHPSIIEQGFPAYHATRKGKALFDGGYSNNDQDLRDLIHDLHIDKGFYAWRKRVSFLVSKKEAAGESLGCYISGHAAPNIAGKFYRFHELPDEFGDIIKAINSLKDPVTGTDGHGR